jgi:hypothetical protein
VRRSAHGVLNSGVRGDDRLGAAGTTVRSPKVRSACSSLAVALGAAAFVAGIGLAATKRLMLAVVQDFEVGDDDDDDQRLAGPGGRRPARDGGERRR